MTCADVSFAEVRCAVTIAEVDATDQAYFDWNLRLLRNTGIANVLDGCAATIPCHSPGEARLASRLPVLAALTVTRSQ